jgi:hypothetical protein
VTGNVQQGGGNLTVINSNVNGNVQINGASTFMISPGTSISNNLQIQRIPGGTALNEVCGTTVKGNLQFQNNGTALLIGTSGPPSPTCPPDMVNGDVQIQTNSAPITMIGDTFNGVLQVQQNSGTTTITGDKVGGAGQVQQNSAASTITGNTFGNGLQVQGNTGATNVTGNTVTGNLQDQNNTAPTQVFNNIIGNILQCQNNTSITGGGNTARLKQGQCSTF